MVQFLLWLIISESKDNEELIHDASIRITRAPDLGQKLDNLCGQSRIGLTMDFPGMNLQAPEETPRIQWEVDKTTLLGKGQFGEVYPGIPKDTTSCPPLAIKIINLRRFDTYALKVFKRELNVMTILKHNNLLCMLGFEVCQVSLQLTSPVQRRR